MTRRSITEEARKRREEGTVDDEPEENTGDDDESERRRFTHRMPEPLVEEIDEFADSHGMSRNAAINLLAKTGLGEFCATRSRQPRSGCELPVRRA